MHVASLPKIGVILASLITATQISPEPIVNPQVVPLTYFGILLSSPVSQPNYATWPSLPFGSNRLLGRISWRHIETSVGAYIGGAFTKAVTPVPTASMDQVVAAGQANNVNLLYSFLETPTWAGGVSGQTWIPTSFQYLNDFVVAVVNRYPSVQNWEIENEFNYVIGTAGSGGGCPGTISACSLTAAQMVTWSQTVYNAVKGINPTYKVVGPSVTNAGCCGSAAPIMTAYLAAGGGAYQDILSFHCYQTSGNVGSIADVINTIQTLEAVYATYGLQNLPIWDTECSYGPNSSYSNTTLQAEFVGKSFLVQWGLGVSRVYHYSYDSNEVGLPTPPAGTAFSPMWTSAGLTSVGIGYQQVQKWMIGAVVNTFALSGMIYDVPISRPNIGYQAEAIWDEGGGPTTFTPPSWATQYRDLSGGLTAISGNITLTASPILLESGSAW